MTNALTRLALVALTIGFAGCSQSTNDSTEATGGPVVMDELPPTLDDAGGHPVHGPHGGDLVELGKEDFHAELVHGGDGISMYVLDGSATKMVPIPSESLVISLKHNGQVATFDLAANPEPGSTSGQSARFTSTDTKLDEWLDAGAEGAVVIQIDGKSFTGKVVHSHDHAGHQH
ncbi:hypothetical protein [Planctomycetes bacterium K23_9]|uniref:Uncharacterized protein n=1 Tax=Stieleria marina TaxID=1930275 RepID=A0A517NSQ7_9BACT|nr:hypothetical protein K239x_21250 [Planctomycetes bacterium K23_9]